MLKEDKGVAMNCGFCNANNQLEEAYLRQILDENENKS